jgi:sulfide dehydrogenase cytochrome subunit
MRLFCIGILGLASVISGPVAGAGLDELLVQCEGCHGPGGVSTDSDVPTIAGQDSGYLKKTLRSFQVWGRPCIKSDYRHGDTSRPRTDMCQVAEGLTTEDIAALGDHFSAQTFKPAAQAFDADLAATGAALHQKHCEQCHEQGGKQPGLEPRLAGQWMPYLRKALKFVPTGEHLVPPAMESVIRDLGPQDIDALMNFYASQQD